MSGTANSTGTGRRMLAWWEAFLGTIAAVHVPQDIAERIYHDRSIVLANMFRVISVAGLNTMLLWAVYFRNAPNRLFLELMFAAGGINYVVLFYKSHLWVQSGAKLHDPAKHVREMFNLLVCLGTIWGILIISMMRVATAIQTGLVYAMIVAGMSTAVLVSPLSIAFAFWVPVTIG